MALQKAKEAAGIEESKEAERFERGGRIDKGEARQRFELGK